MMFHIYKDKANEYRWRLKSRNGKVVADSGEGYKTKKRCEQMIEKIASLHGAIIIDEA